MHSNNSINKIITNYTLCLIPLILYGVYKNGIIPYLYYQSNLWIILKPLIIPIGAYFFGYAFEYFQHHDVSNSFTPLLCLISAMIIPINTPIIIYLICLIGTLLLNKFIHQPINLFILPKIIIALYLVLFATYTYQNSYELSTNLYYSPLDLFFGRSFGGISATSTILCLISYIFLFNTAIYKKTIPPLIIGSFILTSLILSPFYGFTTILHNFLNSTIIFSSIFLATIPIYSPITKQDTLIYSLFIGITSALLVSTLNVYESVYIVIFIAPFITKIISKTLRRYRHSSLI